MDDDVHRQRVFKALQEAVKKDRSKAHVLDLTQLGLVEITRKRVYQDLEEIMRTPCPYCEGRGRVLSAETMANKVRRELRRLCRTSKARALQLYLHPLVYAELDKRGDGWLRHLEETTGRSIRVAPRDGMHIEQMDVLQANTGAELEAAASTRSVAEVHWLDVDEGTLDVAEDEELAQARALAARPAAPEGLWSRVSSMLRRRRSS
jgi:ribonuclease G